jgi:imidazole glycerol-phosphate synthase subunit HisH
MQIGIVDYGVGNILSVYNCIYSLGHDPIIIKDSRKINDFDRIIIPGVGSAYKTLETLKKDQYIEEIKKFYNSGKPILGICLGFQIFAKKLYEDGASDGLGIINGNVMPIQISQVFNIGWCEVTIDKSLAIKIGINEKTDFYFCHSFSLELDIKTEQKNCQGTTYFTKSIPSIIVNKNFIGTQFHPEKSQSNGIKFINFFLNWKP